MRKWEYLLGNEIWVSNYSSKKLEHGVERITQGMDALGAKGWELVAVHTDVNASGSPYYYFKRPLEE
jgi:hypothetical protein